jgi:hypothetical protein
LTNKLYDFEINLSESKRQTLFKYLEEERLYYEKVKDNNPESAFFCINRIIDLKDVLDYEGEDSIYLDFKIMVLHYIDFLKLKDFEYDNVDINIWRDMISIMSIPNRISILEQLQRLLKQYEFRGKIKEIQKLIDINRIKYYWKNKSIPNILRMLLLASSLNVLSLTVSILLLLFLIVIIIQPSFSPSFAIIEVEMIEYSHHSWLNSISNVLAYLFKVDDTMKIKPISPPGVLVVGFVKLLLVVVIANFLWKRVLNNFKMSN